MEEIAKQITINISLAVEILAAIIIGVAVIKTLFNYFLLVKTPFSNLKGRDQGSIRQLGCCFPGIVIGR